MKPLLESTHPKILAAREGTDPAVICRVPSGWVFLCEMQYLPGYCVLQADPQVESINALARMQRAQYLEDMVIVGDALLEITGAYRINYATLGNRDHVLHTHIVPRYLSESEDLRKGGPWSYPQAVMDARVFDYEHDKPLIAKLARSIQKRLINA
jgi:diadenosine tetraphosphate (Ap4A) HIT family hydrolase